MHAKYNFILQPLFLLVDIAALILIYFMSSRIWGTTWTPENQLHHIPLWLIPMVWIGITLILQLYTDRRNKGFRWHLRRINTGFIIMLGMILLVVVFGKYDVSRGVLLLFLFISWIVLNISGSFRWYLLGFIRSKGYNSRFLAFIGNNVEINALQSWISEYPEYGYQKTRIVEVKPNDKPDSIIKHIHDIARKRPMDELAIGTFHHSFPEVDRIIDIAEEYGLRVRLVQDLPKALVPVSHMDIFGPFSVVNIRQEPLNSLGPRMAKRLVDASFSIVVIVLVYWWFYLLAGLFIKLSSRGPIVFQQKRVGRGGKYFVCYKFRTMKPNGSDLAGNGEITREDDHRVTWIGRVLRKTNLDELPQFINVLKGDMSIVGPRPHMVEEDEKVSELLTKYKIRRFVKPGITGWAAVCGYRGGTENMELMQERINHDIYYIEHWTAWLDMKIFFLTIWQMLTFTTKAY